MPSSDAIRWDQRYQQPRSGFEQPRQLLTEHIHLLPPPGMALDVAMGLGGNARTLLAHHWKVVGVDISWMAVRSAKQRFPGLMTFVADLANCYFPPRFFDLILNFYFLQRDLWPRFKQILRPGGMLVMETLTSDMQTIRPDIDPKYLLKPGELREAFSDWEILVYQEGWFNRHTPHPRAVASLIARVN